MLGNAVQTGFAPARVANPDLRWETTRQLDIGLDVGLFDGRVLANMDVYNKKTTGLLLSVPTPWTSGFSISLQNLGSLRNRGIEVAGSAQPDAEPGQIRYRDLNGDGTINADDRTIIGNARPDFTGGFSSNLSYGGFDLSANFNFSVGNGIFNVNKVELALPTGGQNNSTLVLDRWSPSNPDGTVPRPARERARLYVSARNLLTLTGYSGYDPELSQYANSNLSLGYDYGTYPTARTYSVGVSLNL